MTADGPDRLTNADWVHLTPDETILWAGHPSLVPYLPSILLGVGTIIAGIVVLELFAMAAVAFVLAVVGLGLVGAAYLRRISTGYVITSQELYHKRGIVSRDVTQIRFERVQNTAFNQTVTERLLSFGDIAIKTAGTGNVEMILEDIPNPERVNELVTRQLNAAYAGRAEGAR